MGGFADYVEKNLADHYAKGTALPTDSTYVALLTQDPTDTGSTAGELTTAWYSRQQLFTTGAASTPRWTTTTGGGTTAISNATAVTFPSATTVTTTQTINNVGVFTTTTGAVTQNMLFYTTVTSKTIQTNDQVQFQVGDLQVEFQ